MGHINASVDHIERPLMTPDEVLRLKPPQKQRDGDWEKIVAPGQMLIFVSGNYPILGTQMLYFLDPVLTARAAVKPPSEFLALEDGQPIQQRPIDRTRNRLSKPEVVPQERESESDRASIFDLLADSKVASCVLANAEYALSRYINRQNSGFDPRFQT
jgi:type IV secretory pathway TraG/TraD family ATPase VirD4